MNSSPVDPKKVLLIWDRIGEYHAARFRAMETVYGRGNVLIANLGGADRLYQWENPLAGEETFFTLSSKPVEEPDAPNRLRNFKELVKSKGVRTVGIAGYGRTEYRQMLHWCKWNGIRVILFAESWYPGKLDFLKGIYLRFLCHGFLVSGKQAAIHFSENLMLPRNRIRTPYSVVDNRHFASVEPALDSRKILCVARFSPEKNLEKLLLAFGMSGIGKKGWTLELVGAGPLETALKNKSPEGIQFRSWVGYDELPALYQSGAALILPSIFEPWGLVVNEAMASRLPVAVSEECGCAPDLVPDPSFRFPAADLNKMAAVLEMLASMEASKRKETGEQNRRHVAAFSPEAWAEAFLSFTLSA